MSDNAAPAQKSLTDKLGAAAVVGAAIVGAAAVVPQHKIPNLWESIKGIASQGMLAVEETAKKFRPVAFAWGEKLWSFLKWLALVAAALVVAGIEVKTRLGSNVGHVLVAAGTVAFAALGILLFALSDGIAAILFFKFKVIGGALAKAADIAGIELPTPTPAELEERKTKLAAYRDKVRLILAAATVLCFSMLFTMFFPAWSTLGWVMCFWAMVGVALCAALYLDMKMGKAIRAVFYVTIGLIVAMFVIFVLDRLTGGALGFDGFRNWLRAINGSELLVAFLVLIPASLLLVGALSKDKDRKSAFKEASKYVAIGAVVLGGFLLYKGTISWKQLSGNEPPKVITKTADKLEGAYLNALDGSSKTGQAPAPQGTGSHEGRYMAPPTGTAAAPQTEAAPAVRTSKPRAKKPPLPPLKAKEYDDEAAAYADLDSI